MSTIAPISAMFTPHAANEGVICVVMEVSRIRSRARMLDRPSGFIWAGPQPPEMDGDDVSSSTGLLHVSENRRFLVREDGEPFFWLGDTAWELFHRCDREEVDKYLRTRAEQGYTVIQAVVLAELDGLETPNPYGDVPLEDRDPTTPNEGYFEHCDYVIDRAAELGLYVGVLPTWGDKWHHEPGDASGVFTPSNAEAYGRFLSDRYGDRTNIVWILGGDRTVENDRHRRTVAHMARGIRSGDGGENPITFHPRAGQGSAQYFHEEEWLDFNMRQTGHTPVFTDRYEHIRTDYAREPVKPVIDGEPLYEDHPIEFRADERGHSTAADVRRPLYWDLFGGAFGHTYGHHSVWQMWQDGREPINDPLMPWTDALEQPGARQMQYGRQLMESRPMLTRVPDDSIVVPHRVETAIPGAGRYRYAATRDVDGTYAMVYAPTGRPFAVRMDVIDGPEAVARWYDPRTGATERIDTLKGSGERTFTPPEPADLDWVLVLDDVAAAYPSPGTRVP